ncbi:MAG TPA: EAL domain-containing protein [Acidobacteriaceae bacterium]|nr:EAL domain-containing protein [Acidobacteriaceae bacterium]
MIKKTITAHHRARIIRVGAGLAALLLLVWRLEAGSQTLSSSQVRVFIWGAVFLTTVLLVWREKNSTVAHRRASEEDARFIEAAELSTDAFFLLDSVRNSAGDIVDYRFVYANANAERILQTPRSQLLDQDLCVLFPEYRTGGMFDAYRRVELSNEPFVQERSTPTEHGTDRWLNEKVTKLGAGLAITLADITVIKAREERYRNLSDFSNSVFENAPVSIIETDTTGMIQAMNAAAERLTGYRRDELIGKASITNLHDPVELTRHSEDRASQNESQLSGFDLLTSNVARGETDEREWTYIRNDGSTLPVHVALNAVRDGEGAISGFIAIASDITERKQLLTYLNHMVSHDQLTGLPGRTLLRERIAEAIEKAMLHGRKVAVFVIDLDHFKRMNDSLGHRAGDEIIVGMAERMRLSLRRSDTLGRLGGDEFVVVMPHIATLADVERCAKRLVDRVSSTSVVGDLEVNLTASVGVCVYPDFAEDVDSLLERADAATYAAKENGRNQFQIFAEAMLKESQERLSMDTALRHALIRDELVLHYQPIVSLPTGRVIGMEALLRWHHPRLGIISPTTFVPLAEETGLIVAIGEWALKRSCQQAKMLCDALGIDLSVSVNLSPRQFEQSNLLQIIDEALAESGLPAKNLQVELTENTLMINSASNLEKLQRIRQLGARVAIDDFGTGFSSFSYLLQYPVDRLKIDQSFVMKAVTEPNAATVVRTIVAMSHHLGIKVIAEGVETSDHLRFLTRRNCDEAQGYYFSRPVPASAFASAVTAIHRLFDERRALEEFRLAPPDTGEGRYDADQELERQTSAYSVPSQKQIIM